MKLVFLDLETTGLDEATGVILELGMCVLEETSPFTCLAEFTRLVRPTESLPEMTAVVRTMHEENGLLKDLDSARMDCRAVEAAACEFLQPHGKRLLLAGSGVSYFDRRWLIAHMPKLEAMFQYVNLDVGVVRRALQIAGRSDLVASGQFVNGPLGVAHRALDDALDHAAEFRTYMQLFAELPRSEEDTQ